MDARIQESPTIKLDQTSRLLTPSIIEQLQTCSHLPELDIKKLCDQVKNNEESNIQPVSSPVTICTEFIYFGVCT